MDGSVKVDIETGRPVDEKKVFDKNQEQKRLEETARLADISRSEAGNILIDLIRLKLTAKIDEFINNDSECKAYNEMLKGIGSKEASGKRAVKSLLKKHFPISDHEIVV